MEDIIDNEVNEDLEFEAALAAKIEARRKKKKEKTDKNYLNPKELHELLKEHVIMKKINPDHVMSDALGLLIIKLVDEYSNGGQFRGYYNGWKYEMKSRAYEHICRYAHGYNINHTDTNNFFIKWLYRSKENVLEEWFTLKGLSYPEFKANLPTKVIKTPNGKEKTKIGKYISEDEMLNLNSKEMFYNPAIFKEEIFSCRPLLCEDFEDQILKNSFNYLTTYAYHAFIAVIREEKDLNSQKQVLDEKIKYKTDNMDEDTGAADRFMQLDETRIDWAYNLIE